MSDILDDDFLNDDLASEAALSAMEDDGMDLDIGLESNRLSEENLVELNRLLWYQPNSQEDIQALNEGLSLDEQTVTNKWYIDANGEMNIAGETSDLTGACAWSQFCFEQNDALSNMPALGDVVFFDRNQDGQSDHIGFVSFVDKENGRITTIEGNTQPEKDALDTSEGYMVAEQHYSIDDSTIVGYGKLNYGKAAERYGELSGIVMNPCDFRMMYLENLQNECGYIEHNKADEDKLDINIIYTPEHIGFENYTKYHEIIGGEQGAAWCNYFLEAESKVTFQQMNEEHLELKSKYLSEEMEGLTESSGDDTKQVDLESMFPLTQPDIGKLSEKISKKKENVSDKGFLAESRFDFLNESSDENVQSFSLLDEFDL